MKDQVVTQQLQEKYMYFYILFYFKHTNFTEAKILQTQGYRVPYFYLKALYFNISKQKLALRTALTLQHHSGTQPVSRCTWSLVEMSAYVTPAEMLTGSPWASCLHTNAEWWPRLSCTYWEPTSEVLWDSQVPMLHGWVYAWQSTFLLQDECGASLRRQLRYSHPDQIWNQNYPHPSLQDRCLKFICLLFTRKKIWGKSCVLLPDFCYSSDILCKEI